MILEIKFQNDAHLKKGLFFDILYTFFNPEEKMQKFIQHISHFHTNNYFAHPIDYFCLPNSAKLRFHHVWFLFGVTPGVDACSRHGAINK